jgi:hypothetical protein
MCDNLFYKNNKALINDLLLYSDCVVCVCRLYFLCRAVKKNSKKFKKLKNQKRAGEKMKSGK